MLLRVKEDEGTMSVIAEVSKKSVGWLFDWASSSSATISTGKVAEYLVVFDVTDRCTALNLDVTKSRPRSIDISLFVKSMSLIYDKMIEEEQANEPWITF